MPDCPLGPLSSWPGQAGLVRHRLLAPWLFSLTLASLFPATPAFAHRLNVIATVEGKTITGEAVYVSGNPVRNATVTVLDPAGRTIGQTTTDQQGRFSMAIRFRSDHRVVVDAGEGHTKSVTVRADQMPGNLPAPDAAAASPEGKSGLAPAPTAAEGASASSAESQTSTQTAAELLARLEAVEKQLAELRKELARHENNVRLHDILGGIGCILGFTGLAFYFLGVRRKERAERTKPGEGGNHE